MGNRQPKPSLSKTQKKSTSALKISESVLNKSQSQIKTIIVFNLQQIISLFISTVHVIFHINDLVKFLNKLPFVKFIVDLCYFL